MACCSAQNVRNAISGLQISKIFPGGGHFPGPPSYAGPRILLKSDFKLDPPLNL